MIPEDKNLPEEDQGVVVTEPVHECLHEEDWKQVDNLKQRVTTIEVDKEKERQEKEQERRELEKRDKGLKKAFDNNTKELKEIKGIVENLDKKQALTEQLNGFQDEKIDGINIKEREDIRNKWVTIGIIVGAFIGPIVVKVIEYLTPL